MQLTVLTSIIIKTYRETDHIQKTKNLKSNKILIKRIKEIRYKIKGRRKRQNKLTFINQSYWKCSL